MSCMIGRRNRNGVEISPAEAVSFREAIGSYTGDAAHAGFEEADKGSIEEGKLADMAVLSRDPFDCPADELSTITSDLTIVGGRARHVGGRFAGAFTT